MLYFKLEASEDNREADYVALNLEKDITSIALQGYIIIINRSLFLKFNSNHVLDPCVTALKEILGDKFVIFDIPESDVKRIDEVKNEGFSQKIFPGQTH
jgi:hypothetical protein